jgi:transcriptional regulator with XRE-family HTH domain
LAKFHPIEAHVGTRMRQRRTMLAMSQAQLGEALGVTFQQIQKYELGSNRLSPSRLYEVATLLNVPVSYFFDDVPSNALLRRGRQKIGQALQPSEQKDPLIQRETLELVRVYHKISDRRVRARIRLLLKAVGAAIHGEFLASRKGPKVKYSK